MEVHSMASSLEELIATIQKNQSAFTPLTQQQMQEQATNRYKSTYVKSCMPSYSATPMPACP